MRFLTCALLVLLVSGAFAAPVAPDDEFLGPFPSWANVRDYGAVGDGVADDTVALQKALDELKQPTSPKRVLWFPAGTYRITDTLELPRTSHTESQGICIYGEDPEKSILKWDGAAGGVMFLYNPWYAATGRLTFDGAGKARIAIQHGPAFTTANEFSDLIIKDVEIGIEAGMTNGIAETAVLRCRFYRCSRYAVSIQNFNSLDWYLWNCFFEDCGVGVSNEVGAGNFHVYESAFVNSREADVTIKHTGYFSLYGNSSVGSGAFLLAKRADNWQPTETWGANFTVQKNFVFTTATPTPIVFLNNGPLMLLDNSIYAAAGDAEEPVVRVAPTAEQADVISLGNTFGSPQHYTVSGRLREVDDSTASADAIRVALPQPYPFLPRGERPVIEVEEKTSEALQAAVDRAAALGGQRPVVHLPAGTYNLGATVTIPAGSDLQLVGDGMLQATQLNWAGPGEGPILKVLGPSHVTLRNFGMSGGTTARCLLAQGLDQPGGRVFMEQVQTNGHEYGLVVSGLDTANVEMRDHGHNGVQVLGSAEAAAGKKPTGLTALFCGASSRHLFNQDEGIDLYNVDRGGRLLVRDIWYEGQIWHFMNFTGSGEFTYHSGNIAPYAPPNPDDAIIAFDGFRGEVTLSQIEPMNGVIRVKDAPELDLLMLGLITRQAPLRLEEAGGAKVAFLNGRDFRQNGTGTDALPEVGAWDDDWVKARLALLRETAPQPLTPGQPGLTDLRLFRVIVSGREGMRLEGR